MPLFATAETRVGRIRPAGSRLCAAASAATSAAAAALAAALAFTLCLASSRFIAFWSAAPVSLSACAWVAASSVPASTPLAPTGSWVCWVDLGGCRESHRRTPFGE